MYLYYSLYRGVSKKNTHKAGRLGNCGVFVAVAWLPTALQRLVRTFFCWEKKKAPNRKVIILSHQKREFVATQQNNNTKTWEKKRGTFINDKHHSLPPYLQTSPKKTWNLLLRGQADHFPCFFLGGEGGTHHLVCRKFQHPSMTSTSNSQNSRKKTALALPKV